METMMKALVWTFVHSLWQGLLAALIAAVIITATKRTRAQIRYNLLGLLFIAFLIGSVVTFFVQWGLAMEARHASLIQGSSGMVGTVEIQQGLANILSGWFDQNAVWIITLWAVFFFVHCLQLFAGLASVQRLRHYQTHPIAEEWETRLSQLCRLMGINHPVSILQSGLVKVPVAIGFFKPLILLPVGMVNHLPAEQVETILLHELGHIRRKDWLVNILQHFAESVFFFNPAIRWISSLIREEREACCDDLVMDHSAVKNNYLNALVSFQEYANQSSYAMAISSRKQYLLHRIQRMVTRENKRLSMGEKLALVCGLFLFPAFTCIDQIEQSMDPVFPNLVEQSVRTGPYIVVPNGSVNVAFERKDTEKESWSNSFDSKGVTDTFPDRNKKRAVGKGKMKNDPTIEKEFTKEKDKDAKDVLMEIDQLKKQIGARKEGIEARKERLKEKDHDIELEKEIEHEREELELKRKELDLKRREHNRLKEKENAKKFKDARVEQDADLKSKQILKDQDKDLLVQKQINRSVQIRNDALKRELLLKDRKNLQNNNKHALVNKNHAVNNRKYAVDNRKYAVDNRKLIMDKARNINENRKHELDNKRALLGNRKMETFKLDRKPVEKPVPFNKLPKNDKPDNFDQKIRKSPPVPPAPVPANPKEQPPVKIIQ